MIRDPLDATETTQVRPGTEVNPTSSHDLHLREVFSAERTKDETPDIRYLGRYILRVRPEASETGQNNTPAKYYRVNLKN